MLKFDGKVFKKQYGSTYHRIMYWGIGLSLLFVQLAYYPAFFGWNVNLFVVEFLTTLMMMALLATSISGYLYFVSKEKCKNQQVWIDKNQLYFRIEKKIKKENHTFTYRIKRIEKASLERRIIHIDGDIQLKDEVNSNVKMTRIQKLDIPRCFTNEDQVKKVLRIA